MPRPEGGTRLGSASRGSDSWCAPPSAVGPVSGEQEICSDFLNRLDFQIWSPKNFATVSVEMSMC